MTTREQLDSLSAQIKTLTKKHDQLNRQHTDNVRDMLNAIIPEYAYEMYPVDPERPMDDPLGSIRIKRVMANYHEREAIIEEQRPSSWPSMRESVHSVAYFVTQGILQHTGGGYFVLQDPQLCSAEEWKQICEGNIPDKFLKS